MIENFPELRKLWPLAFLLASAAQAGAGDYEYRFTPYIWLPSLQIDMDIGANPPVESETDLLDVLDMAFLAAGEIRRGDDAVLLEFNYLDLSDSVSFFSGGRFGADASVKGIMGSLAWAHRLDTASDLDLDVIAGVRYWDLDLEVDYRRIPTAEVNKNWIDPLVGLRASKPVGTGWRLGGIANIGGFGVGSDFQWEVLVSAEYQYSDQTSLSLGYRHLDLDFEDGNLVLDAAMSGPYVAVSFSW